MTLLQEIQEAATDSRIEISTVLRKAKILSARLKNPEFESWVEYELKGYSDGSMLPPYRVIPIKAFAMLRDEFREWNAAPIMVSLLPEKLRWWGEKCLLRQPIGQLASMAAQESTYQVLWPQEMAVRYGAKGYNRFECLRAWQLMEHSALVGIVEAVRNRILEFVLKIEAENPDAGEAPADSQPVAKEKLPLLVQNVFYGSVGSVAQNSDHFIQTTGMDMTPQDLGKLVSDFAEHLDELKLDSRRRQRAEAQIAALRAELAGEPDSAIVIQAGRTLRNITEGAIGSLLAAAAQPGVWAWIHQTLQRFGGS